MNSTTSQAQIFATEYAKNAAGNMLDVIRTIGKRAGRITKIALGVSMPHQIGYILALAAPHMHFNSVSTVLESVTMVLLAVGVPIATDLLILNCVELIGAAAASKSSKIRAFMLMFIPVIASGTVNFLAPAPALIKVLAAFIVTMVPMGESLKFIRPDFAKIERMETQIAGQITMPVPAVDDASAIDTTTVTAAAIRTAQRKAVDAARLLAAKSPTMRPAELARATSVSAGTAGRILKTVRATAPVSPGPMGPGPAGPSTTQLDDLVGAAAYI